MSPIGIPPTGAVTYVILGSGGHTAEMCKMLTALLSENNVKRDLYTPVRYLVAQTDKTSKTKIVNALESVGIDVVEKDFIEIPRSREVGQSWISTVFTTFYALLWSFWLIWQDRPRLILCNGPGTCVPFCISAYIWRLCGRLTNKTKIVFIESFCRVENLSLSGKLLMPFVDILVVQWKPLKEHYKHKTKVKYFGRLM